MRKMCDGIPRPKDRKETKTPMPPPHNTIPEGGNVDHLSQRERQRIVIPRYLGRLCAGFAACIYIIDTWKYLHPALDRSRRLPHIMQDATTPQA